MSSGRKSRTSRRELAAQLAKTEAELQASRKEAATKEQTFVRFQQTKLSIQHQQSSGAFLPETIDQMERYAPGATDRILTMAEKQADHRMALESKFLGSDIRIRDFGMYFSALILVIAFGVAAYFCSVGNMIAAGIFLGGPITGIVSIFITGRRNQGAERIQKDTERKLAEESLRPSRSRASLDLNQTDHISS